MLYVRCVVRSVPPGMRYSCSDTVEELVSAIKIVNSAFAKGFQSYNEICRWSFTPLASS
jgi:hypothetical protein